MSWSIPFSIRWALKGSEKVTFEKRSEMSEQVAQVCILDHWRQRTTNAKAPSLKPVRVLMEE